MSKYKKEVLEQEVLQFTQKELAEKYKTTQQYISKVLKKFGITCTAENRNNYIPITKEMEQVLIGSLLGDGNITQSKGINSYYRAEHSIKQKDYLEWKYNVLKPLCRGNIKESKREDKRTNKTYYSCYFYTRTHQYLTELRNLFYIDDIKRIPKNLSELLTPMSLAVWYMDDGTNNKSQVKASLTVQGFPLEDILLIQDVLKSKFGLNTYITKRNDKKLGKITYNLDFYKEDTYKLFSLIEPYVIPPMKYKILPLQRLCASPQTGNAVGEEIV